MLSDKLLPVKKRKFQEINIEFIFVSQEFALTENRQCGRTKNS